MFSMKMMKKFTVSDLVEKLNHHQDFIDHLHNLIVENPVAFDFS